jgi:hypothetical protein
VTEKIPKYASIKDSTPKNEEVGLGGRICANPDVRWRRPKYCVEWGHEIPFDKDGLAERSNNRQCFEDCLEK